jgi:hypothetical protein
LDTSEPVALAAAPKVVVTAEEVVVAQVEPDVVPTDLPSNSTEEPVQVTAQPVPEVDLAEVPVVDAEPELPVTPVDREPLVQEPVIESAVGGEPAAPSDDVADGSSPSPVENDVPVVEGSQAPATVTADAVEKLEESAKPETVHIAHFPVATPEPEAGSSADDVVEPLAHGLVPARHVEEVVAEINDADGATELVDQSTQEAIDVHVEPVSAEDDVATRESPEPTEEA